MSKPNPEPFHAAVVREKAGPFQLESIKCGELRGDGVLVRVVATGMCHTNMVARDQVYPIPQPIVLGHEGAGVVEADEDERLVTCPSPFSFDGKGASQWQLL